MSSRLIRLIRPFRWQPGPPRLTPGESQQGGDAATHAHWWPVSSSERGRPTPVCSGRRPRFRSASAA